MALRRRHPARPRGTLLYILLVLTITLSAALAYQAQDAYRSHRATAESTLRDYAGVAAWEYTRRAREALKLLIQYSLWPLEKISTPTGHEHLPPPEWVRATVSNEDCPSCPQLGDIGFYFSIDFRDGAVRTTPCDVPTWFLSWLADTVKVLAKKAPAQRYYSTMLAGPVTGRSDVIAFQLVRDAWDEPVAAYGFHVEFDDIAGFLGKWVMKYPLLPPAIAGELPNDSLLHVKLLTADGRKVYASPVTYPETFAARDTMGQVYGDLFVTASLRPEAAETLVIGGLPRSRVPLLIGLLLLTAGVGVATIVQLRRERELARLRDDFVSGVSHELRTPLAQIRMFAELLDTGRLRTDDERVRSTKIINQEARRLTHLVENVLHFSRVRRGTARLSREEIDLGPLLDEIVEGFLPLAHARKVELRTEIDEGIVVWVDGGALGQVVLNLLDNAVKYGPVGQAVTLRATLTSDRVRITIDDQGPGIPQADRIRVWDAYRRLERDVNAAVGGSGIGLAVVQELVSLHGGTTEVGDAPNGGARFVVEIPGARRSSAVDDDGAAVDDSEEEEARA